VRERHERYFLELAETAEPHLVSADQAVWLKRLAVEQANLNAALKWAQSAGENLIGLRLSAALWRFWWMHSHLSEGRRWLRTFSDAPTGDNAELYRAKALHGAGVQAYHQADYAEARALLERSLAIYRAADNLRGMADALNGLGVVASYQNEYEQSAEYHVEALEVRRQLGDQRGVAISLNNLGLVAHFQEDYPRAIDLFQQSIVLFEALGDVRVKSAVLSNLGRALTGRGEYSQARMCLRRSLSMVRELGNREDSIDAIEALAGVAGATGEAARGALLLGAAEALREKIQSPVAPVAQREYERDLTRIRNQLDFRSFAAAWVRGRAMTLEQAIELALQ
jgi:tetratricopeptide (TPR) repeat protein